MTKIYHCYHCNQAIEFTSKISTTPSGLPTTNPLTQKPKLLDPLTKEYHVCREEDIAAYKTTPEYQNRVAEWKANQGSFNVGNTGNTIHNNITSEAQQQSYTPSKGEDLFLQGKITRDLDYLKKAMLEVMKALNIALSQEEGDI